MNVESDSCDAILYALPYMNVLALAVEGRKKSVTRSAHVVLRHSTLIHSQPLSLPLLTIHQALRGFVCIQTLTALSIHTS